MIHPPLWLPNRRLAKAYLLRDQLGQLWAYTDEDWARRFLTMWLRALRWQWLPAFQKLGRPPTRHLDGALSYCQGHEYLLLKVQRAVATRRPGSVLDLSPRRVEPERCGHSSGSVVQRRTARRGRSAPRASTGQPTSR